MIWRRLSALIVGLAFVFATTEPLGAHHCPLHDGIVAEMAGMTGHHHMPAHGQSHQCSCLGASCCTVAVTVPMGRLVALPVVPVRVVRSTAVSRTADQRPVSAHDDVVLYPPVGPPAALLV
jgi:hypothetical protein